MNLVLFDQLLSLATYHEQELLLAQKEWEQLSDTIYPTHPCYEQQIDAFLEWYLVERKNSEGVIPIKQLLSQPTLTKEQEKFALALDRSYRSLFQIQKMMPGQVFVLDVWGGNHFLITERRQLYGLHPGDLFEGRLIPQLDNPPEVFFGKTFLMHPREVTTLLLNWVQKAQHAGESQLMFLGRLQKLRLRAMAYQHLSSMMIYEKGDGLASKPL